MEEQPTKVNLLDAITRAKARLYGNSSKRIPDVDRQIKDWVRYVCKFNEAPEPGQVIVVEWNRRFIPITIQTCAVPHVCPSGKHAVL
jgi:hypothetical protein